jgi:hypothetical protein
MQFQSQCVQNKQIVTEPAVCEMNVCFVSNGFPGKGLLTKDTNKFEFEFDWCELGFVMNRL